jgi:hypothetical protein
MGLMNYRGAVLGIVCLVSVPVVFAWGCSSPGNGFNTDGGPDATATDGANTDGLDCPFCGVEAGDAATCVNLQCDLPVCTGVNTTTITGTVYAPNGTLPLYNVIVYVPNAALDPLPVGVTCDQCGADVSGNPVTVALTDSTGAFTLTNAPAGSNIPLVMQVGKWRREITIPTVTPCVANAVGQQLNGVEQLTRLPKKQSEGNMPRIAITTGGCETFACIMPKLGIDPSEYAPGPTSSTTLPKTAFSFYSGGNSGAPAGSPPAQPFWNDVKQLKNFDLAMFSCECSEPGDANATSYAAVRSYLEAGGRIFTTDFMYVWYKYSTDTNLNASPWSWPGGAPSGGDPVGVETTFPKGQALGDWMYYVSGIAPYKSEVHTYPPVKDVFPVSAAGGYVFDNVHAINTKYGLEWVQSGQTGLSDAPVHPRVITMGMPSADPPASQCGKGVHIDFHVDQQYDRVDSTYPAGCSNNMREPELAVTFFFFDIASCIQDDTKPPPIPQ